MDATTRVPKFGSTQKRLSGIMALGLLLACSAERGSTGPEDPGSVPADGDDLDGDGGARGPGGGGGSGAGGGGAGRGAGNELDGSSGDKGRPADVCAEFPIPAYTQTPEILLVLDRSGSMRDAFVDRWGPSVAAVESITQALEGSIHFGLLTFPGDCLTLPQADQLACLSRLGGVDQSLSCEPGRVDVPVAPGNASAIATQLQRTSPSGATPTAASILSASKALQELPAHPSQGSKSILLVTDGAPNCSLGLGGLLAVGVNSASGQSEAVSQTVTAIEQADKAGIRTHVIGYQTQTDPFLRASLDQMASAGGTGDSTHRPVEDQATLVNMLQELSQKALHCELKLDQPVTDLSRLRVLLSGQPVAQDAANGFTLSSDQKTITLHGSSCEALRGSNGVPLGRAQLLCPPNDAGAPVPPITI